MANRKYTVVGIGELLWDLLPAGRQLGGAPSNFAYLTNLLGDEGIPASRIGDDALGHEAHQRLAELGLNSAFVQRDPLHPTGTTNVAVDDDGQSCFDIARPVAWDFFEWTNSWRDLAARADAVCFGSLAQRSPKSRAAILNFMRATQPQSVRVFDVNLRQDFYSTEVISESMKLATIVKLNHDERPVVMRLLKMESGDERESAQRLVDLYDLKLVCVTRGARGSLLVTPEEATEHPGFRVKVADTVGAGDAFTATLLHGYLRGMPLAEINEAANRVGAWVASQSGATPSVPEGSGWQQAVAGIL